MKKTALVSLCFLFYTSSVNAKKVDYWDETNLSFAFLESDYVNDNICGYNAKFFMGCLAAVNEMLHFSGRDARLVMAPSHTLAQNADLVQDLGYAQIMDVRKPVQTQYVSAKAAYDVFIKQRELYLQTWEGLFAQGRLIHFKFKPLFDVAKKLIDLQQVSEQQVVGMSLNEYIHVTSDPHSNYVPKKFSEANQAPAYSSYVGVGVSLTEVQEGLLIVKVVEGGGAAKAGIKRNDIITGVDRERVTVMTSEGAQSRILGPEHSFVKLEILRQGESLNFDVERLKIEVQRIEFKFIPTMTSGQVAGLFRLDNFNVYSACVAYAKALKATEENTNAVGLILDLRGNGGGTVDIASCMLSYHLPPDQVVMTIRRGLSLQETSTVFVSKTGLPSAGPALERAKTLYDVPTELFLFKKPLVVLVDGSSASASEVFAGVTQDYHVGFVVGSRTRGKGTAQQRELHDSIANLYMVVTIGRFFLPSGRSNQLTGIVPEFEAYASMQPRDEEKLFFREADVFRNPYPAVMGQSMPQHPQQKQVAQCVQKNGQALLQYKPEKEFDVLTAIDVLTCVALLPKH